MRTIHKKRRLFLLLIILIAIIGITYFYFAKNKPVTIKSDEQVSDVLPINEETEEIIENNSLSEDFYDESIKQDDYEIVGKTSKGYDIILKDDVYYIEDILIVNKTFSLPSTYYTGGLTKEFLTNWYKMQNAAKNEGLTIFVKSGFRSYVDQKIIYNNYVNNDGQENADTYSARPGHSEHQTGLAADLNGDYMNFGSTLEAAWVKKNCYKYGFIIRYPEGKEEITGYIYESWHIRYVGEELATKLYNDGTWLTLEEYFGISSRYQDGN